MSNNFWQERYYCCFLLLQVSEVQYRHTGIAALVKTGYVGGIGIDN